MKRIVAVSLLLLSASFALIAAPRWWRKLTPEGAAIACETAGNEETMIEVLRRAGWNTETIPTVDWKREYVVIIAPDKWYKGKELVSLESKEVGDQYQVHYGWQPIPPDTVGSNSASFGSRSAGPETIAVAVPKSVSLRVWCYVHEP